MFKAENNEYQLFIFKEIRQEINETLFFINSFCFEKNITSLKNYFSYCSNKNQLYPDVLDHLMQMKLSPYYLISNFAFMQFYYHLHSDIRNELDLYLQFENKMKILKQNTFLMSYLKKILNKNFYFEQYRAA